ncbi:hypothetical protein D3C73_1258070 [compost metagenome]
MAGVLGEAGNVEAGAAFVTRTVDDARQRLALLARLAVHRIEAAAEAGDGLADQVTGAFHFATRTVDLVADEVAQFGQQLVLLAQDAGMFRGTVRLGAGGPPRKAEPAQRHRGQDRPAQGDRPFETDGEGEQQGQSQGGGQTDENA